MDKYRKLLKRQHLQKREKSVEAQKLEASSETLPSPPSESPAEAVWQPFRERAEVPSLPEGWEAIDVQPFNSTSLSQWQQELREIEWEIENEVWESCPYD
ncbi:hypothetical protein C7B80_11600 [Cyanosarcina cf. burmensis CCALA 770]|nr:hypothetical protein C7B80_11600 [Cyanosarcina cf. burmensis CCALA 770]